ncbi:hypothetical protein HZA57_00090 [Candidatus Poribacteria bacterium]|nr:hypothetical protein [Candidatus Poribacteria bacterium]
MKTILLRVAVLGALTAALTSCARKEGDKCYLPMDRYRAMKDVFEESGSIQRAEQAMEENQWAACERNQFRYMLAKDLDIEGLQAEVEIDDLK